MSGLEADSSQITSVVARWICAFAGKTMGVSKNPLPLTKGGLGWGEILYNKHPLRDPKAECLGAVDSRLRGNDESGMTM
jgi:hypothetical protein